MAEEVGQVIACHTEAEWKEQLAKAAKSGKPIVVDFTASWCPPCRFIAPIFVEMAKANPSLIFLKVDVDELNGVAKEYDVTAMPTFLFLKQGKDGKEGKEGEVELHRIVGALKEDLANKVRELNSSLATASSA